MIYINKRTRATIDSPCLLSGEDWELISEAVETKEADAKENEEVAEKAVETKEAKEEKPKKRNNKKGE